MTSQEQRIQHQAEMLARSKGYSMDQITSINTDDRGELASIGVVRWHGPFRPQLRAVAMHGNLTKPPLTKYIYDALTGHVIASRTVGLSDPFDGSWIMEAVASYFEEPRDNFESLETDDRPDGIGLRGRVVAFVETN